MSTAQRVPGPGAREGLAILAAAVALEVATVAALPAGELTEKQALVATGLLRSLEVFLVFLYGRWRGWSPAAFGLVGPAAARGLAMGCRISALLALGAGAVEMAFRWSNNGSFLERVTGVPPGPGALVPLLLVGGLVGPLFEELLFRGVLYGGLRRRLSVLPALAVATALFAAAHLSGGIPWVQTVGGVVFCLAYEISGSLWAPLVVHVTGNLALFLLPLLSA